MTLLRPAAFLVACLLVAGCGGGDKIYDVKGTVTVGDTPVPDGVIWFDPATGNATGPQGFAYIKGGAFDTRANGKGVRPGAYTLKVEAFDGKPANELPFGKPLLDEPHEQPHQFAAADAELKVDVPAPGR